MRREILWVDVKDRLPAELHNVLIFTVYPIGSVICAYHCHKSWRLDEYGWIKDEDVTHWAELPQGPT